jgi:hypothetical protein
MTSYAVYRYGCNAANQSMTPKMLVAIVEASNSEEAAAVDAPEQLSVHSPATAKLAPAVTVWANQFLSALPVSKVSAGELRAFEENQAMEARS